MCGQVDGAGENGGHGVDFPVLVPITPKEYNEIRERYLKDTFHVRYTDQMIQFQQIGSHLAGGELLEVFVPIGQQLAGVALALDIGIRRQGVDIAHRDVLSVGPWPAPLPNT